MFFECPISLFQQAYWSRMASTLTWLLGACRPTWAPGSSPTSPPIPASSPPWSKTCPPSAGLCSCTTPACWRWRALTRLGLVGWWRLCHLVGGWVGWAWRWPVYRPRPPAMDSWCWPWILWPDCLTPTGLTTCLFSLSM